MLTKVHLVKAMVFPVVIYGCESSTIKKVEHWRIYAVELWCWRRLFSVPWTTRRSNQSILKKISLECSLEGLMLKLKLQYFGHLMRRTDSMEKTPQKDWRQEKKGETEDEMVGWHHQLDDMSLRKLWELVMDGEAAVHGIAEWEMTEQWADPHCYLFWVFGRGSDFQSTSCLLIWALFWITSGWVFLTCVFTSSILPAF